MSGIGGGLRLPQPSPDYDQAREAERNRAIERADAQNHKRGRDIEVGASSERLILTSPNGTRYSVVVDNAGALSTTAV